MPRETVAYQVNSARNALTLYSSSFYMLDSHVPFGGTNFNNVVLSSLQVT